MNLYKIDGDNGVAYVGALEPAAAIEMYRSHHKIEAHIRVFVSARIKDAKNVKEGFVSTRKLIKEYAQLFGDAVSDDTITDATD